MRAAVGSACLTVEPRATVNPPILAVCDPASALASALAIDFVARALASDSSLAAIDSMKTEPRGRLRDAASVTVDLNAACAQRPRSLGGQCDQAPQSC